MNQQSSEFIQHVPCGECGSSDANSLYSDGHQFCFACDAYVPAEGEVQQSAPKKAKGLESGGEYVYLRARKIPEEVCRKFGYRVKDNMQIAPYYDAGGVEVAQKIRKPGKEFYVLGDLKQAGLFGQKLFGQGGKRLIIVEGEVDALSTYHMNGGWPVVSVPNGAQGAKKSIQKSLEWIETFDSVVICFDNDEVGRAAAKECAELLTPGKAKIATLPLKDANEMLVAGRVKDFMSCIYEATVMRPDGIVNMADTWDLMEQEVIMGTPYPWAGLNDLLMGLRGGEVVTFGAGSGVGKSAITAEIAFHLLKMGETVGYVALEEGVRRTGLRFMGMELNKPLHLPGQTVTPEERRSAFDATLGTGRLYTYDHFGSLEGDNLLSKLRFMVKGFGVKWLVLDHISIVVSGMEADDDERKAIDRLMTRLRSFAEETGVGILLVSHLKRPEGKGHEEGARVTLAQFRGSASIAQLSDAVIGVERDQQAEDPEERNTTTLRVLKNRYAGTTGVAGWLSFSADTGRLGEIGDPATGGEDPPF